MEASTANYVEALARLSLFADLSHPQLESLAHSFDEEMFAEGQRVIRQDVTGGGFYVILDGEAKVVIDGQEMTRGPRTATTAGTSVNAASTAAATAIASAGPIERKMLRDDSTIAMKAMMTAPPADAIASPARSTAWVTECSPVLGGTGTMRPVAAGSTSPTLGPGRAGSRTAQARPMVPVATRTSSVDSSQPGGRDLEGGSVGTTGMRTAPKDRGLQADFGLLEE